LNFEIGMLPNLCKIFMPFYISGFESIIENSTINGPTHFVIPNFVIINFVIKWFVITKFEIANLEIAKFAFTNFVIMNL